MPRPLRVEYEGAWYHIMNRGLNRQKIFLANKHYQMFLTLLDEISIKYFLEIHSYCLMSNHYHLLVRTPLANLSRAMRHLDGIYTQKFNRSSNRDGPLFRGRYKSILVEAESYLMQLSRYIHLNPTEARISDDPYQYPWSSLQFYTTSKDKPSWLKTDVILHSNNSEEIYKKFINEGIDEFLQNFYKKENVPAILGTKKFVKEKLDKINKSNEKSYSPDIRRIKQQIKLEKIITTVAKHFQINPHEIKIKIPGKTNLPKMIAIYLASQMGQFSNSQIGDYVNLKSCSVGASIKNFKKIGNHNDEIIKHLNELFDLLLQ